ncbi:MAG: Fic family protein, partial [Bacteroidota bacterium]
EWHRGSYKKHSNVVEANFPDGTRQVIFQTTAPGFATQDEMQEMVRWYNEESEIHPLIKIGTLIYEFLSIHPFQDGNGRLSRLLTTLLLLKNGYQWIQYVSLEHEVENRKKEYYRSLRNCQSQRPGENINEWIDFFLASLVNVQNKLEAKLSFSGIESQMAPREKAIYTYIENHPGCKSGEIAQKLDIPNPTVKRILSQLVKDKLIKKHGKGAGVNYSIP